MGADASELRALAGDMRQADEKVRRQVSQVIRKGALDIEAAAKGLAPVDTGTLKGSISTTVEGELAASVGPTVEYGVYLEYGTYRMPPQPYMGPALDRVAPSIEQALGQVGGDVL